MLRTKRKSTMAKNAKRQKKKGHETDKNDQKKGQEKGCPIVVISVIVVDLLLAS